MAQVDVYIEFNNLSNQIFFVDAQLDQYEAIEYIFFPDVYTIEHDSSEVNEDYLFLDTRCFKDIEAEAYRKTIDIIYDSYSDNIFNVEWNGQLLYDVDIKFDILNNSLRVRSGMCADVPLIQSYTFRAYNTNLLKYVFWKAGTTLINQDIAGYDPQYLSDIAIISFN